MASREYTEKENEFLKLLKQYYEFISLKSVIRTGWELWNIYGARKESIAEHIYGAQTLAFLMYSQFPIDVDIFKVVTMLAVHETEEIDIGDIAVISNVPELEKMEKGINAVNERASKLKKGDLLKSLVDEFNERKTKEAIFAYLCDKMDSDLQAKKYSDDGNMSIYYAKSQS